MGEDQVRLGGRRPHPDRKNSGGQQTTGNAHSHWARPHPFPHKAGPYCNVGFLAFATLSNWIRPNSFAYCSPWDIIPSAPLELVGFRVELCTLDRGGFLANPITLTENETDLDVARAVYEVAAAQATNSIVVLRHKARIIRRSDRC
jgi:hypothetical protein